MRAAIAASLLSLASPSLAGDISLQSPIDCALGPGEACYIQNYLDHDPGPGFADFACQRLGYDGHNGTDFALRSFDALSQDVAVQAAAAGTIKAVRDGMADTLYRDGDDLQGRDCGNGVVITHAEGWETQYCHLKNGSIAVQPGDRVDPGTRLGAVGLSGRTQFPHVHLSLRKNGSPVDPFAPRPRDTCSEDTAADTLWAEPIAYQPGGLLASGFSDRVPDYDTVKQGTAGRKKLGQSSAALVLWGFGFGSRPGDVMTLRIRGPNGIEVFSTKAELTKTQAQYFRAGGRKTQNARWFQPGTYIGIVTLTRGARVLGETTTQVEVTR